MEDFINYLTKHFGESAEKLAKTSEDNPLFDFDLQMIDLENAIPLLTPRSAEVNGDATPAGLNS